MLSQLRANTTFANTMSVLAFFVAVGGTSYAALSRDSVGSRAIKANAVKESEVATGAVGADEVADGTLTGTEILDGSLGSIDLGANSVTGAKVADGGLGLADLGPDSVDGSKVVNDSLAGADVAAGTFLGGKVTVQFTEADADLADGDSVTIQAFCLPGQTALGGGARGDDQDSEATIVGSSRPAISEANTQPPHDNESFNGWRVTVANPTGGVTTGIRPDVWVICSELP